jgi:hypothetical protein
MSEQVKTSKQEYKMQERLHMRKLYSGLTSLDSAVNYMKSEDFEKGGWFVLAYQAMEIKKIKEDIHFIREALTQKPCNLVTMPAPVKSHDWTPVYKAAFQFQKEAIEGQFNLVFNPHSLTEWIRLDSVDKNILAGCWRRGEETKYKYEILKDEFIDKLLVLRKQMRQVKKLTSFDTQELERFIRARKDKMGANA